ncbi:hypothetical protein BDFB_008803 [Asbolus verrucosus]|uniref:Uncharacterized protein n=1 Tax=Asbolus verrucosus TaxID=1661398 RepID=A0A482W4N8_ASBVE|nr:hypothetical protein BDFB_008803 [Asbolus verrucosus]
MGRFRDLKDIMAKILK